MSAAEAQLVGWPLPASDVERTESIRSRVAMLVSAGTRTERSMSVITQAGVRSQDEESGEASAGEKKNSIAVSAPMRTTRTGHGQTPRHRAGVRPHARSAMPPGAWHRLHTQR